MIIEYLTYKQIDKKRWDECIDTADNSLIYAYSFYLDSLQIKWDAIIVDDYKTVCPLPWKKKVGIKYFYPPPFTQQLGFFGKGKITITDEIINLLENKTKYGGIHFNYNNILFNKIIMKNNFVLSLSKGYAHCFSLYKNVLKKNLKVAAKEKLIYTDNVYSEQIILLYQKYYFKKTPHIKKSDYNKLYFLYNQLSKKQMAFTRSVISNDNELLSAGIFFKDKCRIYHIMNVTTPKGKKKTASHFLLDSVIKEFSGKNLILDFEGSDLPGVKSFYEGFGPVNQPYFFYHFNNLPKVIKLLKK